MFSHSVGNSHNSFVYYTSESEDGSGDEDNADKYPKITKTETIFGDVEFVGDLLETEDGDRNSLGDSFSSINVVEYEDTSLWPEEEPDEPLTRSEIIDNQPSFVDTFRHQVQSNIKQNKSIEVNQIFPEKKKEPSTSTTNKSTNFSTIKKEIACFTQPIFNIKDESAIKISSLKGRGICLLKTLSLPFQTLSVVVELAYHTFSLMSYLASIGMFREKWNLEILKKHSLKTVDALGASLLITVTSVVRLARYLLGAFITPSLALGKKTDHEPTIHEVDNPQLHAKKSLFAETYREVSAIGSSIYEVKDQKNTRITSLRGRGICLGMTVTIVPSTFIYLCSNLVKKITGFALHLLHLINGEANWNFRHFTYQFVDVIDAGGHVMVTPLTEPVLFSRTVLGATIHPGIALGWENDPLSRALKEISEKIPQRRPVLQHEPDDDEDI